LTKKAAENAPKSLEDRRTAVKRIIDALKKK
jgi:hypothetical protein